MAKLDIQLPVVIKIEPQILKLLAVNAEAAAQKLHLRKVEHPDLGKKYFWNLRANLLEDIAGVLVHAAQQLEEMDVGSFEEVNDG